MVLMVLVVVAVLLDIAVLHQVLKWVEMVEMV
jgi:uncharacterized membrane protein